MRPSGGFPLGGASPRPLGLRVLWWVGWPCLFSLGSLLSLSFCCLGSPFPAVSPALSLACLLVLLPPPPRTPALTPVRVMGAFFMTHGAWGSCHEPPTSWVSMPVPWIFRDERGERI